MSCALPQAWSTRRLATISGITVLTSSWIGRPPTVYTDWAGLLTKPITDAAVPVANVPAMTLVLVITCRGGAMAGGGPATLLPGGLVEAALCQLPSSLSRNHATVDAGPGAQEKASALDLDPAEPVAHDAK